MAYCITSSTDANHVTTFLEAIKKAAPEIVPPVIVTDDDNAEWSAVQKVFPGIKRFLCQFHVRKSWGFNLNKAGAKGVVFKSLQEELQVLIAECDQDSFNVKLDAFKSLSQQVCLPFYNYFVSNWCAPERINMWAQFPRDKENMNDVTTNNYIESYHNILKNDPRYFDKKGNNRFDKLILVLLQHEADQNDAMEHVLYFGTLLRNDRRKSALINGQVILDSEVAIQSPCFGNQFSFSVQSQSDANCVYKVSFCKQCRCGYSNEVWCNHVFKCSCPVFKARHRPCKHVGAVFRIYKELLQGVSIFQPANTSSVSHLGDANAVSKRLAAHLDRMIQQAANLMNKLSSLKTAVEESMSQQGNFSSSTDNMALLRKLDSVDQALKATCNCADVVVAVAPVLVVVPALVPSVKIAHGAHFIKQKLYATHKTPGRKPKPTFEPVSAARRVIVGDAMQSRGTALQQQQPILENAMQSQAEHEATGVVDTTVSSEDSEEDQEDYGKDEEREQPAADTTIMIADVSDKEVKSFYLNKIYMTTEKLAEYQAVSPDLDRDLWYSNPILGTLITLP